MTPSEREEIEKVARDISRGDTQIEWEIVEAILTQVAKARKEALEEAAKIVESTYKELLNGEFLTKYSLCEFIVKKIRNKLEKE